MKSMILLFFISIQVKIIFNEIMYDPDPPVGLPEYEYLELFNRSGKEVNLENWYLDLGSKRIIFPGYTVKPGSYLLLVYPGTSPLYPGASEILEIMHSRTLLLNKGEILCLRDETGDLVDWIEYSASMHSDPYFSQGGWSLERIDPDRLCGQEVNWGSSKNRAGGTPGRENSIEADNPDHIRPEMEEMFVPDSITLVMVFSEAMQTDALTSKSTYLIEQGSLYPADISVSVPHNREVVMRLNRPLDHGKVYSLEIIHPVADCSGLAMAGSQKYRFALPVYPLKSNILISEIMFDPLPGCPEFLEVYNASGNAIDLDDLRIAHRDPSDGHVIHIQPIVKRNRLIFPGELTVLSRDTENLRQCYHTGDPCLLARVPDMYSFDNRSGKILVLDRWLNKIDEMHYSESMHFPLLSTTRGVSLERLSYIFTSADPDNWHSASSMEGFATPGRENSQSYVEVSQESKIHIEPEVFSPDQDGWEDLCFIRYKFDSPGHVISVRIFDHRGRLVATIAVNELAGLEGFFTWDGTNGLGQKARTGIYLVFVEVFDLTGRCRTYKKACVLSPGKN